MALTSYLLKKIEGMEKKEEKGEKEKKEIFMSNFTCQSQLYRSSKLLENHKQNTCVNTDETKFKY